MEKLIDEFLLIMIRMVLVASLLCSSSCRQGDGVDSVNDCSIVEIGGMNITTIDADSRYRQTLYLNDKDTDLLLAYSPNYHRIDIIDINSGTRQEAITFNNIGPNRIGEVRSMAALELSEIYLLTDDRIIIINDRGEIKRSFVINKEGADFPNLDFSDVHLYNDMMNGAPMVIVEKNKLLIPLRKVGETPDNAGYYTGSKLSLVDLESKNIDLLKVYYPNNFKQAFYPFNKFHLTYDGENIVYSFANSSQLYLLENFSADSKKYKYGELSGADSEEYSGDLYDEIGMKKYMSSNTEHLHLIYNQFDGNYYKFHYGPFPTELNEYVGKRGYLFLTVFNNDLEVIASRNLKWDYQYYGAAATPKGLLLYKASNIEDSATYSFFNTICE